MPCKITARFEAQPRCLHETEKSEGRRESWIRARAVDKRANMLMSSITSDKGGLSRGLTINSAFGRAKLIGTRQGKGNSGVLFSASKLIANQGRCLLHLKFLDRALFDYLRGTQGCNPSRRHANLVTGVFRCQPA